MLATLADGPFNRIGWIFEVKWDGYRAIAEVNRRAIQLYSRNNLSFNHSYPAIVSALRNVNRQAVLDGEIVVLDEKGRSHFQLLQKYRRTGVGTLTYYVFDLLELDGKDLRRLPLVERRRLLEPVVDKVSGIRLSESVKDRGIEFFDAAVELGLEGMLAKDGSSPYIEGRRTRSWLKIKSHNRQEAVIGGFTLPRGSREHLGALVLGVFEGSDLVYIGHTGGGSSDEELSALRRKLNPLVQTECPFRVRPKVNAPVHWVTPKLVCEVNFQEWSVAGRMRQPIFVGIREDKSAHLVQREIPVKPEENA